MSLRSCGNGPVVPAQAGTTRDLADTAYGSPPTRGRRKRRIGHPPPSIFTCQTAIRISDDGTFDIICPPSSVLRRSKQPTLRPPGRSVGDREARRGRFFLRPLEHEEVDR